MKKLFIAGLVLLVLVCCHYRRTIFRPLLAQVRPHATVEDRLKQYGQKARKRWAPFFEKATTEYPPHKFILLGLKEEARLEVYVKDKAGEVHFIRVFPVCAQSGVRGPKLREGDGQVPEGVYRINFLNANSSYHLSLRVNYPNAYDKMQAKREGRTNLGGDIMIHGDCVSIGCLAMEDLAAEDLFVLAADTGIQKSQVILAPFDMRVRPPGQDIYDTLPKWAPELYAAIKAELEKLPRKQRQ